MQTLELKDASEKSIQFSFEAYEKLKEIEKYAKKIVKADNHLAQIAEHFGWESEQKEDAELVVEKAIATLREFINGDTEDLG